MQEVDAERRMRILRGEREDNLPSLRPSDFNIKASADQLNSPEKQITPRSHRKRRRIAGEDDTDRDIRLAREDVAQHNAQQDQLESSQRSRNQNSEHVSILDSSGHINLFTEQMTRNQRVETNVEAESEKRKKEQAAQNQYTMRFSNAAGCHKLPGEKPWYSTQWSQNQEPTNTMRTTDVWGNEDPRRQEREKARIDANDPLALMKAGIRGLKNVHKERKEWQKQRLRELEDMEIKRETEMKRRKRKLDSRDPTNSLENFSLEGNNTVDPISSPRNPCDNGKSPHRNESGRRHRHRDHHRHG